MGQKVFCRLLGVAILLLALAFVSSPARANVYATNVRLNNSTTNVIVASGLGFSVSYILNEPATLGVVVSIQSSNSTLRTITITNGPGTLKGTNTVVWDGKDTAGQNPSGGSYSVSVTPAAAGYSDWTQISDDANPGNYVWEPRGIAVNRNTNSLYYGRVYVANAAEGPHPESNPGDAVGFQKLNADGSPAAEGIFSSGGYPWVGDFFSPWKLDVADDDVVYVDDFTGSGVVLSFDAQLSTNSLKYVLRSDNYPNPGVNLSGPFVTGGGTNTQLWMADDRSGGVGIRRWDVGTGGIVATNDKGTTIVAAGAGSDLAAYPFDVAVDKSNRIYTIQNRVGLGDPLYRVLRFPAYTNIPETAADWKIGSGDNSLRNLLGVAVDPTATYVAVAVGGLTGSPGNVRVFSATNGSQIATLGNNIQTDVAWDNAGNVYSTDNADSVWRVYSPPGTNQATTVAVQQVQILAPPANAPLLSGPLYTNGQFQFTLNGQPDVAYRILSSPDLVTWTPIATNKSSSATRVITVPATGDANFYRAQVTQYVPGEASLSDPVYSGGQFHFTLTGDPGVSYIIWGSGDLVSWTSVQTNSSPAAVRSISVTAPATQRFYRALPGS